MDAHVALPQARAAALPTVVARIYIASSAPSAQPDGIAPSSSKSARSKRRCGDG